MCFVFLADEEQGNSFAEYNLFSIKIKNYDKR